MLEFISLPLKSKKKIKWEYERSIKTPINKIQDFFRKNKILILNYKLTLTYTLPKLNFLTIMS